MKKYSDTEITALDLFKDNIQLFISDFNIENCEMNNDKNDVINISNYNKYFK